MIFGGKENFENFVPKKNSVENKSFFKISPESAWEAKSLCLVFLRMFYGTTRRAKHTERYTRTYYKGIDLVAVWNWLYRDCTEYARYYIPQNGGMENYGGKFPQIFQIFAW